MMWEYKIISSDESPVYVFTLNDLGEDGWELAAVVLVGNIEYFYFKREVA